MVSRVMDHATRIAWCLSLLYLWDGLGHGADLFLHPRYVSTISVLLGSLLVALVEMVRSLWDGNRSVGISLLGLLPLIMTSVLDILKSRDVLDTPYLATGGFLALFGPELCPSKRLTEAERTAERLTANLKDEARDPNQSP